MRRTAAALLLTGGLVLTGCSSSGSSSASTPSASPAATQATLPAATSYVVTARDGVSTAQLRAALDSISKLASVSGASIEGAHRLRVDLKRDFKESERVQIVDELEKLGVVTIP